jgi:polyhydroxyalkanoate synthase
MRCDSINVLGICEGGSFVVHAHSTRRVKNLIVTITPVDFHADQAEGRTDHGIYHLWTRSLTPKYVDRLIEATAICR